MSVQSAEVDQINVDSSNTLENDQESTLQAETTAATTNGEKTDEFKIFVSNIPQEFTSKQLEELFSPVGNILKVKILSSRFKKSNNFAFVSFEDAEKASEAIEQFNGKDLEGRPLKVEAAVERNRSNRPKSKPRNKKTGSALNENSENPDQTSQEPLPAGEKPKNPRSRRHRKKPSTNGASNAGEESLDKNTTGENNESPELTNGNGEEADESQSKDKSSKPRGPRRKSFNSRRKSTGPRENSLATLYVSNLPGSLTDEGLLQVFGTFGAVKAYIIRSPYNKRSKRFGFVEFSSTEDQQRALTDIGEVEINGRVLSVSIALNRPSVEETTTSPPASTEA